MNQYTRYLGLKAIIEDILGSEAWYALKETNHLPTWKKQLLRVINAIHTSILASIEIFDEDWLEKINEAVASGKTDVETATDIEEAISSLAAVFVNVSFLQVGFMPMRKGNREKVSLRKENWRLNQFRTVMYVQSPQQKESLFRHKQQKEIGYQNQMDLWVEYLRSKSKLKYPEWCRERNA